MHLWSLWAKEAGSDATIGLRGNCTHSVQVLDVRWHHSIKRYFKRRIPFDGFSQVKCSNSSASWVLINPFLLEAFHRQQSPGPFERCNLAPSPLDHVRGAQEGGQGESGIWRTFGSEVAAFSPHQFCVGNEQSELAWTVREFFARYLEK